MKEIISYQESPIPIPHPDEAWEDMRDRLRNSIPEGVAAGSAEPATPIRRLPPIRIITTTVLLLLSVLCPLRLLMPVHHSLSDTYSPSIPYTTSANPSSPSPVTPPAPNTPPLPNTTSTPSTSSAPPSINPPASLYYGEFAPIEPTSPTNTSSSPIQQHTPASAAPPPTPKPETAIHQNESQYLLLQLGLQWTAQVPTDNPHTYLDGANGHTRLYRPLLPAAWIHLQWDRSLLEFTFDPFYSNLVPIKPYSRQQNFDTISYTAMNVLQSNALSKLFGFAAGAGYSANLGGKWWVGGGIQTIWWVHAIVTTYTLKVEQPVGASWVRPQFVSTNSTSALPGSDWKDFLTFQLDAYAQLLYNSTNGHAGFRAGFPFSVLSRDAGPTKPLRLEFFYRLPLLTRRVRAAATPE